MRKKTIPFATLSDDDRAKKESLPKVGIVEGEVGYDGRYYDDPEGSTSEFGVHRRGYW